jgi:hypothetical protein
LDAFANLHKLPGDEEEGWREDYREGDIEERVFEGIILADCHLQLLCVAALLKGV